MVWMFHIYSGHREGKRKRDLSPTHTGRRRRKSEEERTGRNTWYSGRISLCIRPKRYWAWVLTGNPDDLARSGQKCSDRKPTHTGVGLTNPALSPVVPISAFCQDLVVMRAVVRPAGVQIEGLSFGRLGFRSRGCGGLYAFFACECAMLGSDRGAAGVHILLIFLSIRVIFF
jgi:hypothetical protein